MSAGLSAQEAQQRLSQHGYNELPSARPKNIWRIAVEVFKEPMFLLLISAGVLYIILGDFREGIIMLLTILVIIFITFYQYRRTERALEALKSMSSPQTVVIREGKEVKIPGREVVPDDVMLVNEGDRIAADGTLIESINLTVDESLLTGESIAVNKSVQKDSSEAGLVYSGTLVVRGKGKALVNSTGVKTKFGQIGTSLAQIEQDETRLQKEMKVLIRYLFLIGGLLSCIIVFVYYITRGNFLQSLLNGIAAAMAILPEEFPVVLTVFLALGAWHLSKKKVLTRKPSAIETLGSATVLCSDKTGTITLNKMEVAALNNGNQSFLREDFQSHGNEIQEAITIAHQASPPESIDPMERAIHEAYEKLVTGNKPELKLIKEYPLSDDVLAMTRVVEDVSQHSVMISTKGAPESVFNLCKLNPEETKKQLDTVQSLAEKGYRVLALANGTGQPGNLPENQKDLSLAYKGLVGLEDPIRPEVPQAIKECYEAGIKVIMITGDYPATAKNIGTQAGLPPDGEMITGEDLKQMSDEQLKEKISRAIIFARVVPEQKLKIVEALKANNEVVAMTGDGVNDAPALKAAHIGISMGNKGTDVAREASSLVLLDDHFASIVAAIRSGRRIFDNLQKAFSYIMAIHIPIIGLTMFPAFFPLLPLLLMPLHIVFMELIIDPICSVAFESEEEEKGIMNRPPRKPDVKFFGWSRMLFSLFQGFLLFLIVLGTYFYSLQTEHTEGEIRVLSFSTLIIGNIFLILTNLSKTRSFISIFRFKNIAALIMLTGAFILLLLLIFIPALRETFSFEVPGFRHFIPSIVGAFCLLIILEVYKFLRNRKKRFIKTVQGVL